MVAMERYVSDSGIGGKTSFEVDESTFGEVEIIGKEYKAGRKYGK